MSNLAAVQTRSIRDHVNNALDELQRIALCEAPVYPSFPDVCLGLKAAQVEITLALGAMGDSWFPFPPQVGE